MIWYLDDLQENPEAVIPFLAAIGLVILLGLAFHEFCHAWAAYQLGDDTAARQGRLTLNPLAHVDPIGTTLIALIGFGWAKPTPVNPFRLSPGPDRGNAIVAFAGPASNFVFAAAAAVPIRMGLVDPGPFSSIDAIIRAGDGEAFIFLMLFLFVWLNVILGIFNLIPIAPLDGFKVASGILPHEIARVLKQLEPYGPGILMGLILLGWMTPFNPIGELLFGISSRMLDFLLA